jgi:SAM-dependent methyltransferase
MAAGERMTKGGYDDGYKLCPCFWGREPSSLVRRLEEWLPALDGLRVLDAGCGEGKNAAFFAERGAVVDAFDISALAIAHARALFSTAPNLRLAVADVRDMPLAPAVYDVVVAYGVLHCLPDEAAVRSVLDRLAEATRPGGLHVVCVFNDRSQDLSAHPELTPVLLQHEWYWNCPDLVDTQRGPR